MSSNRPEKIADLLKKEVSIILSQEVRDPRLHNINITAVKVTDDISIAYVYYTIIGKSINIKQSKIENDVLIKLSGMVRYKGNAPKYHLTPSDNNKMRANVAKT